MTKIHSIYERLVENLDKYNVYDYNNALVNSFDTDQEAIEFAVEHDGEKVELVSSQRSEPEIIWERGFDEWKKCDWCNEYFPESDLSKTDIGWLCDQCYSGVSSREPVSRYPRGAYDDDMDEYFDAMDYTEQDEEFTEDLHYGWSREELISAIKKLGGQNYKFDKYSNPQLLYMLDERERHALKVKQAKERAEREQAEAKWREEAEREYQLKLDDFIVDDQQELSEGKKRKKKCNNKMGYFINFYRDPEKDIEIFNHLTKYNDQFKSDADADSASDTENSTAADAGGAE